jgi:hypothetical protein
MKMLDTNDMIARRTQETESAIAYADEALQHRIEALSAQNDDDRAFFAEMAEWAESSAVIAHERANDWHIHL